ncbi:cytoplasmic protein [Bdellovibrio sp. qaytius]|nr:cytoplasmic protein [Bdellovibrio sp. qaytius]
MIQIISKAKAQEFLLDAQRLNVANPFGKGPEAVLNAITHLGYVQIDTINVIERCHHHILYNRIPGYKLSDLHRAQTIDKSIFEYWTHALAYVPTSDYGFFMNDMKARKVNPGPWFSKVTPEELKKVISTIKRDGALTIRDIEDDVLVEKDHDWASKKPSKRALQLGFHNGDLAISERLGMLKKYELSARHFNWDKKPKAATPLEVNNYMIDRTLRSQALVDVNGICHLEKAARKNEIKKLLEGRVKKGQLIEVAIKDKEKQIFYIEPEVFETKMKPSALVHILSPFDPLTIQRKRLEFFFDYAHRFEAYLPKDKRIFGYFALPILVDNQIKAVIDLKTDRDKRELRIQQWTWLAKHKSVSTKQRIEEQLNRFEKFQLAKV